MFGGDEVGGRRLTQDTAQSRTDNPTTQAAGIISAERVTTWNPGLNAVGGIPDRTTIYQTLSPRGGSLDYTVAIQRALNACPRGQVVKRCGRCLQSQRQLKTPKKRSSAVLHGRLPNLLNVRRAIAAAAWSGIAKTELTLISHKT